MSPPQRFNFVLENAKIFELAFVIIYRITVANSMHKQ